MTKSKKVEGVEFIDIVYTVDGYDLVLTRDDGDGVNIDLDSDSFELLRELFMLKSKKH